MSLSTIYRNLRAGISMRSRVPEDILKRAGSGFMCGKHAFFRPNERIIIGNNVFIGHYVHISAPCTIKDDVLIASYVSFVGGDHSFSTPGRLMNSSGRDLMYPIIVEEDVWIGHGAIVMTGVTIHRGSIVSAGSIVTKDIPSCSIWGGVPAKYLRDRFSSDIEKEMHLDFLRKRYDKANYD